MVLTPHQLHRATRRKSSLLRLFIDSYIKKKVLSKIKPHFFGFDFLEMVTNRVALVKKYLRAIQGFWEVYHGFSANYFQYPMIVLFPVVN